jgi:hypothetical protein
MLTGKQDAEVAPAEIDKRGRAVIETEEQQIKKSGFN